MHVVEGVLRAKYGDVAKTFKWWKDLVQKDRAFKNNGEALSRMAEKTAY